ERGGGEAEAHHGTRAPARDGPSGDEPERRSTDPDEGEGGGGRGPGPAELGEERGEEDRKRVGDAGHQQPAGEGEHEPPAGETLRGRGHGPDYDRAAPPYARRLAEGPAHPLHAGSPGP